MAIDDGSLVEIVVNCEGLNGQQLNAWQYEMGTVPPTVSAVQIAESWWNHVKAVYRGIYTVNYAGYFRTIRIRELNNLAGDYAEFDIPVGEQAGTRANPTQAELMPPMTCSAVRLVVGTRVTRPGQKRFSNLAEGDQISGNITGTANTSLATMMALMVATMTLGAPAATTTMIPIVTRKNGAGLVTAHQNITGFLISPRISTQNTRKYGRGA